MVYLRSIGVLSQRDDAKDDINLRDLSPITLLHYIRTCIEILHTKRLCNSALPITKPQRQAQNFHLKLACTSSHSTHQAQRVGYAERTLASRSSYYTQLAALRRPHRQKHVLVSPLPRPHSLTPHMPKTQASLPTPTPRLRGNHHHLQLTSAAPVLSRCAAHRRARDRRHPRRVHARERGVAPRQLRAHAGPARVGADGGFAHASSEVGGREGP